MSARIAGPQLWTMATEAGLLKVVVGARVCEFADEAPARGRQDARPAHWDARWADRLGDFGHFPVPLVPNTFLPLQLLFLPSAAANPNRSWRTHSDSLGCLAPVEAAFTSARTMPPSLSAAAPQTPARPRRTGVVRRPICGHLPSRPTRTRTCPGRTATTPRASRYGTRASSTGLRSWGAAPAIHAPKACVLPTTCDQQS